MAPSKDTEQSDDWRNQAGQSQRPGQGNRQQGQRKKGGKDAAAEYTANHGRAGVPDNLD